MNPNHGLRDETEYSLVDKPTAAPEEKPARRRRRPPTVESVLEDLDALSDDDFVSVMAEFQRPGRARCPSCGARSRRETFSGAGFAGVSPPGEEPLGPATVRGCMCPTPGEE